MLFFACGRVAVIAKEPAPQLEPKQALIVNELSDFLYGASLISIKKGLQISCAMDRPVTRFGKDLGMALVERMSKNRDLPGLSYEQPMKALTRHRERDRCHPLDETIPSIRLAEAVKFLRGRSIYRVHLFAD